MHKMYSKNSMNLFKYLLFESLNSQVELSFYISICYQFAFNLLCKLVESLSVSVSQFSNLSKKSQSKIA